MHIKNVRLAAFDMDGTLLNRQSQMADATKEACLALKEQGVKVIISTGRPLTSSMLPCGGFPFDGYVCNNGAVVYDHEGKLLTSSILDPEQVITMVQAVQERTIYLELHDIHSNRWMIAEDRDRIEAMLPDARLSGEFSLRHLCFHQLTKAIARDELYAQIRDGTVQLAKLFFWNEDPTQTNWAREQLQPWIGKVTLTTSGKRNIEVIPRGVNKWTGLSHFLDKWNIDPAQTICFGDAENDREMLAQAGYPVAMENATEEIQALTPYIAPHHDEEGVARFIREHVLTSDGNIQFG